jgi:hypothetical protein
VKAKIHILILFLSLAFNAKSQDKYTFPAEERDFTFPEFVAVAEKTYPLHFFYRDEWVKGVTVHVSEECYTLSCILNHAFERTALYFLVEASGNVVITNNYAVKVNVGPAVEDRNYLAAGEFDNSGEKGQLTGVTSVEIGNPAEKYRHGNVIISGYITDRDTKEPVAGVTVYVEKLAVGTISNEYGYYRLTIPRGNHLIQFSSIGFKEKIISVNLNGAGEMDMEMKTVITPLKEVVVSAEKSVTLQRFEVGAEKLNIAAFKLLPTSMGEADIIKSVLMIPGVQSVGEASSGFNVRGGSADQNLILLYGAPVYNSSHFFGFFSAVNSDLIKDVTLYKGGIPSRYGGRISSVLDIGSKDGNRNEFHGSAGISPITAHVMVEGPIIKDTLSYLLTARTTYSNWIFGFIEDPAVQNSRAFFYDINGRITYDPNKNNRIELSAYNSHDAFKFNTDTIYKYNNSIYALKWRHFFSSRFFTAVSVNNSMYNYEISSTASPLEAFTLAHKISSTGIKADFNWFPGKNEVNFGLDLTRYNVNPGTYMPNGDSSNVTPTAIEKEMAWEGALYIDDKLMLTKFLSLSAGIRMSAYYSFGPQSVMVYNPAIPKSRSSITDTLHFSSGEVTGKYGGPEFRVSLNFRLSDKSSFKLNYNRTRQYLHLLSNSASISPTDVWKLCDYYLKPQVGDQVAAGFYKMLHNNRYEASAEIYYKGIRNMIDYKGGTNLVMDDNIEKDIVDVKGKAYGLELQFKKTEGKIRYSLGYTFSRTFIRSEGDFPEDNINSGSWFPANFDKPHDLAVTFYYLLSRRFSFSSNYVYSTGRPITFPVATYVMYENHLVHYSDRNKYRIPYYSRLDLSFKVNGNLRSHKIAHPNWTFSVYNVLGRENVYSIYFKQDGDQIKGYKLSVFGRAIPTVTFNFDF